MRTFRGYAISAACGTLSKKQRSMTNKKTFASLFESLRGQSQHDHRTVFDDFLTTLLCTYSIDSLTGLMQDEKLLSDTLHRYSETAQLMFPDLLIALQTETKDRADSSSGNDVIGEYYEANFENVGMAKTFLPWQECQRVAKDVIGRLKGDDSPRMRILIPCCGSGRLLVAARQQAGWQNEFYGIDSDPTCAKMAILNLYMNPVYYGETMQSDTPDPKEYNGSYASPAFPDGIVTLDRKEQSRLWYLLRNKFSDGPALATANGFNIAVEVF